jgi:uncharacterized protein YyaL (SSP411 family)
MHPRRRLALALAACGALSGASAVAEPADSVSVSAVEWRAFDAAAFAEAEERGLPVFLLLTAAWNRDHYLLVPRLLADPEAARALNERTVPVRADASRFPELRRLYSISSGLLPSFHFLDAEGRPHTSLPPLEREELLYFLDEMADPAERPPATEPKKRLTWEMNPKKLANRIARSLVQRLGRDGADLAPPHADLDPSPLTFLAEYCGAYAYHRRMVPTLQREVGELLSGPLHDPVDGGFHRAVADPERGIPHHEKLLRPNAELGGTFATVFRMTRESATAKAAVSTLRCLNRRFGVRAESLYAAVVSADVYVGDPPRLAMPGVAYYHLGAAARRRVHAPPVSRVVPVGGNAVVLASLLRYAHAFPEIDALAAAQRLGRRLLEDGLGADGTARRSFGRDGRGNLRDQADAGSGLITWHALTGEPVALDAARTIADALVRDFWWEDSLAFRSVSVDADVPAFVRDAPPDVAWNGTALRFLADLGAVLADDRWRGTVERSLTAWADRVPVDGYGAGDLGRAALRAERPLPVLLVVAEPGSPEAEELLGTALRLYDPLVLLRWVDPRDARTARRFGVRPEGAPALYLAWDRPTGPIRDAETLGALYDESRGHVRR